MESQCKPRVGFAEREAQIPFDLFVVSLAAWYVLKMLCEALLKHCKPDFYEDLQSDIRKRLEVYLGTWVTLVFKAIALVACGIAVLTTPAATDLMGVVRPVSAAEQVCWGCRMAMYVQELPHFGLWSEIVIHHLLSIVGTMFVWHYRLNRRQIYLSWAVLLPEYLKYVRRILRMHKLATPRIEHNFSLIMALSMLALRIGANFVALGWSLNQAPLGSTGVLVNAGCQLLYLVYNIRLTLAEAKKAGLIEFRLSKPARVVFGSCCHVSFFSFMAGFGMICSQLAAVLMYEHVHNYSSTPAQLNKVLSAVLQSVVAGLATTYFGRTLVQNASSSPYRPSLNLRAGIVVAFALLFFSRSVSSVFDRLTLVACVALSLPLMEAIASIGSHFGALSSTRTQRATKDLAAAPDATAPMPPTAKTSTPAASSASPFLVSSLFNGALYFGLVASVHFNLLLLHRAAAFALALRRLIWHAITQAERKHMLRLRSELAIKANTTPDEPTRLISPQRILLFVSRLSQTAPLLCDFVVMAAWASDKHQLILVSALIETVFEWTVAACAVYLVTKYMAYALMMPGKISKPTNSTQTTKSQSSASDSDTTIVEVDTRPPKKSTSLLSLRNLSLAVSALMVGVIVYTIIWGEGAPPKRLADDVLADTAAAAGTADALTLLGTVAASWSFIVTMLVSFAAPVAVFSGLDAF